MSLQANNVLTGSVIGQNIPICNDFGIVKRPPKNQADINMTQVQKKLISRADEEALIEAIETANKKFEFYQTRLEFSIHEKTHHIMIKVFKNDDLVKEIPPEKILDMVAMMLEVAGLLVDEKV